MKLASAMIEEVKRDVSSGFDLQMTKFLDTISQTQKPMISAPIIETVRPDAGLIMNAKLMLKSLYDSQVLNFANEVQF